jgi:hypothetical protein
MQNKKALNINDLLSVDLDRKPAMLRESEDQGTDPVAKFKSIMSYLESSNNKNTKHSTIRSGIHAGHTAQGRTGLMPNTVTELAKRRQLAGNTDELDKLILKSSPKEIQKLVATNPEIYNRYEDDLARLVLDRAGNDLEAAAAKWRWGHNRPLQDTRKILDSEPIYRQRFKEAKRLVEAKEARDKELLESIPINLRLP